MTAALQGKVRPFCRGHSAGAIAPWFPRSASQPRGASSRWALFSPAHQLSGLASPGWFLVDCHQYHAAGYHPSANPCGVLPEPFVDALEARLGDFFWDPERFAIP
jgi:hypothetical protein